MIRYWIKHILHLLGTMFGVLCLVFFLFNVLPGDPAQMMLGQHETEEQIEQIHSKYGLNLPLHQQFMFWVNDVSPISVHQTEVPNQINYWSQEKYSGIYVELSTSFGVAVKAPYLRESFQKKGQKVNSIIASKIKNTFVLAFTSISIAFVLGVLLGIYLQSSTNVFMKNTVELLSLTGMALPSFFASVLIAWFFGFYLSDYLPFSMTGSLFEVDDFGEGRYIEWKNLVLPALTLGIRPLAVISQLTKSSLEEVMNEDYIRTAKSKGLSNRVVLWKHALKNALNPVITATSGWFASLLAGAVFVEYIFAWDGIGKLLVESLENLDLPLVMGIVLFIAAIFVLINIFVDLFYKLLDPRIKL